MRCESAFKGMWLGGQEVGRSAEMFERSEVASRLVREEGTCWKVHLLPKRQMPCGR